VIWIFVVVVVEICGFFEPGDVGLCCGGCCDFWITGWLFWWVVVGSRWAVDLFERFVVWIVVGGGCGGSGREVGGGMGSRWAVVWIVVGGGCGGQWRMWCLEFFLFFIYFFFTSHQTP
jgi:hypothetical protein